MKAIDFGSDEEFIKNYERLKSSRKMGEIYHCDKASVTAHARKIGYEYDKNPLKGKYGTDEEFIQSFKQLKTAKAMSEKYGVSTNAIRNHCRKIGFDFTAITQADAPNYGQDADFIQNYQELKNTQLMAEKYGVSTAAIRQHASKIGLDIKAITQQDYKLTDKNKNYIKEMYQTKTSTELAEELNVSRGMVTKIWFDAGLKGKEHRSYYFNNQHFFENINSEEKAYLLGFFAADGCMYDPQRGEKQKIIRFKLAKKDIEILKLYQKYFDTNKPIQESTHNGFEYVNLEVSSNLMFQDLLNLGLEPRKTYKKTWVELPTIELQNAFIRGFFDGDGSISTSFDPNTLHQVGITIAGFSHNLYYFIDYLKNILNINPRFIEDKRENKYTMDEPFGNLVLVNKKDKYEFLKAIYPENSKIYLTRKYNLAQKYIDLYTKNPIGWTTSAQ